jgi:acyl-CoA synthetase (AMP-forming)/AMP-acid ligase II
MLKLDSREKYKTLLDAQVLAGDAPDSPAIVYVASDAEPITVTRGEFHAHAAQYGSALAALGVQARDLVIVAHTQNLESIYAFWGALMIGAIPSMFTTLTEKLDPTIYMANMAELARVSSVRAIVTTDEFAGVLREHIGCEVFGSAQLGTAANGVTPISEREAGETAFLQHSSGTTGLQKGVALSHESVLNQLAAYADALELNERDVIVSWLPLYHDMGLIAGFIQPLVQGIPLVLMSPFDWVAHPTMLLKAIHDYKGTLCWLPNFAYNHLAARTRPRDTDGYDLSSMRAFINCSEPVRHESHRLFAARFATNGVTMDKLAVSYAMAENTFAVTQTPIGSAARIDVIDRTALQIGLRAISIDPDASGAAPQVSCGSVIKHTHVKIVNANGIELAERHIGAIGVKSNCMLTEYYHRPDLHPFDATGWYDTGDRGYIADGEVYVIGRSKDLIINAGKNVYPQDIEAVVNDVEGVHAGRAVAFGVYDEAEGTELIAVVAEVETDDSARRKAISAAIRQAVARSTEVIVTYVKLVDKHWLIKTSSGKIARGANRDKWLNERKQ